jgi:hypothetical protein
VLRKPTMDNQIQDASRPAHENKVDELPIASEQLHLVEAIAAALGVSGRMWLIGK